jgi:hypothetical protein
VDLLRIAERLEQFDPDHYEAYTVPNLGPSFVGSASVIRPDFRAMSVMFGAIARNESPAEADGVPGIEPSVISVGVYNGTFEAGAARAAANKLEKATDVGRGPVTIADANIANAGHYGYKRSVIRYSLAKPEARAMAQLLGAAVPGARVTSGRTDPGVDVAVIVGKRFVTRPIVQILPIPIPPPDRLPRVCRR